MVENKVNYLRMFSPLFYLFKRLRLFNNYYLSNISAFFRGNIITLGKAPVCSQLTKITGLGKVEIGKNCSFGYKLGGFYYAGCIELQARYANSYLKIGNNVGTNNNLYISAANHIEIGDDTLIGPNVTITDFEAHGLSAMRRREIGEIGTVVIGKNVWIGANVMILKNVVVGDNTIIAAGSIVNKKFPADVILAGSPAKVIKHL